MLGNLAIGHSKNIDYCPSSIIWFGFDQSMDYDEVALGNDVPDIELDPGMLSETLGQRF